MIKLKFKSTGKKVQEHNVGAVKNISHSEVTHILDGITERYEPKQPEVKEKKVKSPRKVVYISKSGSKAVFDSVHLCAKIFGVDESTVRFKIANPVAKRKTKEDWLKGGKLEYIN